MLDMWLARHTPAKVLPILRKVIDGAKEEFADAIASGGGIYCAGYCFGAKYALLLGGAPTVEDEQEAKQDEEEQAAVKTAEPIAKAVAIAHGTQITVDDVAGLKVPACLICVDDDPLFPNEVRIAGVVELEKAGLKHEVKVYPEVPHGFAVYGDYENEKIKEAQKTAFTQMLAWLQDH
jgi:dienelactone hydrolase